MIRMAYLDNVALYEKIKEAYIELMDTKTLRRHWRKVRNDCIELREFNYSIKQLLSAPFSELLVVAKAFDNVLVGATDERKQEIKEKLRNEVFKYDHYYQRAKISPFFREHAEEFGLHACHYCDMAYINTYEYVDKKDGHRIKSSHFDLDHVLEKVDYPIFALSLFNLVPCCPVCNERLKGKEPLAKTSRVLRKFSPTCQSFDFDSKVTIELMPLGDVKLPFLKNASGYELDFDSHKDKDYEKYIDRFRLKERYNYHKGEALRLKDLQMRYPDVNIANIASMLHVPFDEVKEDIFGMRFGKEQHRCFGKLKRDMLK